ncbi:MAG: alpha/beta fold hydrolase, partial [Armatimonadota bacterium]
MPDFSLDLPLSMQRLRETIARVPSPVEAFDMFARPPRVEPARKEAIFIEAAERFDVHDNGDRIAAYAWGTGPVVALVHGWGGRGVSLCSFIQPLLDRGFRVVAFDGPGHGDSEGSVCNVLRMSRCLVALQEKEGGFAGVIGHSFGAGGITVALGKGLDVARVVQIAPLVDMVERFRQWATAVGLSIEGFREMMRHSDMVYGRGAVKAASGDLIAPKLEVPALILHDPEDDEVPITGALRLVGSWRGALLEETPKLGHYK